MNVTLRMTTSSNAPAEFPVSTSRFLIGRGLDCDLSVPCRFASRHHCELIVEDDQVAVRDLESNNGTYVNGGRIWGQLTINHGDILTVGLRLLEVRITNRWVCEMEPPLSMASAAAAA